MYIFIDEYKKNYISSFLKKKLFIHLNNSEFNGIIYFLINIIDYIIIKFNINNFNDFWLSLIDNNNSNIIALLYLLIPYINDENNFKLFNKIINLSDISIKKNTNNNKNINNYKITNIQYSLYIDIQDEKEIKYTLNFIEINYFLLVSTLDRISN